MEGTSKMGRIITRPRTPVAAQLLRPDIKPHGSLILKPGHSDRPNVLAVLYNDKLHNGVRDLARQDLLSASGNFSYTHRGIHLDATTTELVSGKTTGITTAFSAVLKMRRTSDAAGAYMCGQYLPDQLKWGLYYQTSNNTYYGYLRPTASGSAFLNFGVLDDTYPIAFGLSWDGTTFKGFVDGLYHSQATKTGIMPDAEFRINDQETITQEHELSLVWDYLLPDAAMKEYTARPYQLFQAANDAPFRYSEAIPPVTGEDNAILMGSNF